MTDRHVIITGGAGYVGSVLTGALLRRGDWVTVVDDLLVGGESLLAYLPYPAFHFMRGDVCRPGVLEKAAHEAVGRGVPAATAVIHLAAIVGFPACQAVGRQVAWRYNVEAVQQVFGDADAMGVGRLIFASTYSTYGAAEDGTPVTEDSELSPQSLYAETKIAAEAFLLEAARDAQCAPLIFRLATLYGVSPRMRFDLIVNQFVLEAFTQGELVIYQKGYSRSFVHVQDAVDGMLTGLEAPEPKIRGQIYNLGTEEGNYTKDEIVALVRRVLPETQVRYKDLSFGGDMRDIRVSFAKIREGLGFRARRRVGEGVDEVLHLLRSGIIQDPNSARFRNAHFIVQ
jgi:nucleoside-diphosphate-sugar epimerase